MPYNTPVNKAPIKKKLNSRRFIAENCPKLVSLKRLKCGSLSNRRQQTLIKIINAGINQFAKYSRKANPIKGKNIKTAVNSNHLY